VEFGGLGLTRDGGMAEFVVVPETHLVRTGDLDLTQAAPLADAGLTAYRAIALCRDALRPGTQCVVIGALVDAASVRAKIRGPLTGPNPVDRGKPGSKLHVPTDAAGLPLAVATSAANTHDSLALIPLVQALPAIRSRRGPRRRRPGRLHADKGYDYPHLRAWLRARQITPRIAPASWRAARSSAATAGSSNARWPG
jgi:hypothetical protein